MSHLREPKCAYDDVTVELLYSHLLQTYDDGENLGDCSWNRSTSSELESTFDA